MRFSVEKLRWGLLIGGGLLLLLVAGLLGYSRYRAVLAWRSILARSGATLTRETNGFTYSQSLGGRTVFTLHAAKAVQAKDGKYALHDVSLLLYRQADGRPDRIYGSDFEYDEKTGVAKALGEVHMDLQAPGVLHRGSVKNKSQAETNADAAVSLSDTSPSDSDASSEDEPETIHVKTSGLVYVRKLGVAATDQDVEFAYGGMQCHARGAEFDSGQSTVHLLANVQGSGQLRGKEVDLTAARADLDRSSNVATLSRVEVRSDELSAGAENAVLYLTPNGLLQSAKAGGSVHAARGTQVVHASRAQAVLGADSALREARFFDGVSFVDTDKEQPLQGHAEALQASFGPHDALQSMLTEGNVLVQANRTMYGAASGRSGPDGLRRELSGRRVEATFAELKTRAKPVLDELKIDGEAHIAGESFVQAKPIAGTGNAGHVSPARPGGLARTQVAADTLRLTFVPGVKGQPEPETLTGNGHTVFQQNLPGGAARRSTGDRLTLRFAPRDARTQENADAGGANMVAETQVTSAVQEGHITLRDVSLRTPGPVIAKSGDSKSAEDIREGSARRLEFAAEEHRLSLTGQAHLSSAEGDLTAAHVNLDSDRGETKAEGQVRITLLSGTAHDKSTPSESTHIAASEARFVRSFNTADFHGTDAAPVRLWQGGSQLEAATLLLDRGHDTLSARPETAAGFIRAVFVQGRRLDAEKAGSASTHKQTLLSTGATQGTGALHVTSSRLEYSGATREAIFSGGVRTSGPVGEARSQTAVVFLQAAGGEAKSKGAAGAAESSALAQTTPAGGFLGGSVEKVVLTGKVQMEQPGRYGSGEQLLYTAATSSFVLTGSPGRPARIADTAQGSTTGGTLLFRTGDNTVVVAGDSAQGGAARGRVRTELNLHP